MSISLHLPHRAKSPSQPLAIMHAIVIIDMIVSQFNTTVRAGAKLTKGRTQELKNRDDIENKFLRTTEQMVGWNEDDDYHEGRLSGSLAWRISRGEMRDKTEERSESTAQEKDELSFSHVYHVETFHPAPYNNSICDIEISVPSAPITKHSCVRDCIRVMGVACGSLRSQTASVVVVDEKNSCILQSRVFTSWTGVNQFIGTIPDERIVAICSDLVPSTKDSRKEVQLLSQSCNLNFSQFGPDDLKESYLCCISQINCSPDWGVSAMKGLGDSIAVELEIPITHPKDSNLELSCEVDTVPQNIALRLPDKFLSLDAQMHANDEEKISAFFRFIEQEKGDGSDFSYVGFCTKLGTPVYLIQKDSFPFQKCNTLDTEVRWKTYHYIPGALAKREKKVSYIISYHVGAYIE